MTPRPEDDTRERLARMEAQHAALNALVAEAVRELREARVALASRVDALERAKAWAGGYAAAILSVGAVLGAMGKWFVDWFSKTPPQTPHN